MANRVIYCVSTPFGRDIDCSNSDTTLMVSNQFPKNKLSICFVLWSLYCGACIVELVLWSLYCGAGILARLIYKTPSYRYLDIDNRQ